MKLFLGCVLAVVLAGCPFAAGAQGWNWLKGATGGESEGYYNATDGVGSVYVTGNHWGSITFGTTTVTGAGAYVARYDSTGGLRWVISTQTVASSSSVLGLASDHYGHEYLLGWHDTTVTFGGFTIPNPGAHNYYYYLAKMDSAGNVLWLQNLGNVSSMVGLNGDLKTDDAGNLYVTCGFYKSPVLGAYTLTNAADTTNDILVAHLDSAGNVLWARNFGGIRNDNPMSIAVAGPSVYVAGYFGSDTLMMGADTLTDTGATHNLTATFLARLDTSGNVIWTRTSGGGGLDQAAGVAASASNVYVAGRFTQKGVAMGTYSLPDPPAGNLYGFVASYDSAGNVVWVKGLQGYYVRPWKLALDPCENAWITATFMGTGPVAGWTDTLDGNVITSPAFANDPMVLAGWSKEGVFQQALTLASGGDDLSSLAIDRCGHIFVEGDYESSTFIVGADTLHTTSTELNFVARYDPAMGCGDCGARLTVAPTETGTFALYPDPATDVLTISGRDVIGYLEVCDLTGRVLIAETPHATTTTLSVNNLPAGLYVVRVDGAVAGKFVKY
jgi:Secretion system C-terminal sorting domain